MTNWTPQTKSSTNWNTISQNIASWANIARTMVNDLLLLENGSYMLLETGNRVILEQSVVGQTSWATVTKS